MDAGTGGGDERLTGALDVVWPASRERRDDRPSNFCRDSTDGFGVGLGRNRKTGFDHVHAKRVELPGQLQLLVHFQRESRRLFAVAQGRVEDDDPVCHGPSHSKLSGRATMQSSL